VLDVGKLESGAPYMVMEFLEGSDLGKILNERGPLPVDAAADWILQACEAVAEAHAAGIVHRDLKPENLFLARTVGGGLKIKVLDFGVSKAVGGGASGDMSGLTRTRAMLGSPLYMAPEQMRSSRDVDARADVWALGVVLFQLLTQRWPFEAETMPELCLKVVTEPPIPLGALRPDVPAGICGVVQRCLEKDLKRRFANAAEVASALEPFVQPGSRVLADRARLAMGSGSGAHAAPLAAATPSAPTMPSGSGSTPGTSAPWGTDRVNTPTPQVSPPPSPRIPRVALAIAGVALAAGAGFAVLTTRGASNGAPPRPEAPLGVATDLPGPAANPALSTSTAAAVPVAAEPALGASPVAPQSDAMAVVPPTIATSAAPRPVPAPSAGVAGVLRNKVAVPAQPPTGKTTSTDDDIPTIR
jgi:serine/threonine-protein kinase